MTIRPHVTTPGIGSVHDPQFATDLSASNGIEATSTDRQVGHSVARNAGFDALRASLTLLVVMHHAAITYGAMGGWFYREVPTDRSLSSTLLVYFCTVNQAFFMGMFFLLAGYLTPAAINRHGLRHYVMDRLKRLGLPLLFFGWILGPVTIAMAQTSRGHPFVQTWTRLLRAGTFENGPLWFAQALLLFACAAVVWVSARSVERVQPQQANGPRPWPSDAALLGAAWATGACAVALRAFWPVGVNVWGLQLGYFASYGVLFAFGFVAAGPAWLELLPPQKVRTWWTVACFALPVLPIV
ncbi:MAG: acyltransferase, partial [Rhodoferax sp.]|uniref:acyltransferase family protein n=1 Tax=Rhodoferax sp. TaxID=50421 RepID=UPI003264507B